MLGKSKFFLIKNQQFVKTESENQNYYSGLSYK